MAAAISLRFFRSWAYWVASTMARKRAPNVLGAVSAISRRVANAQHGWPGQMSLESIQMKPTSSCTARWLNGSGAR